LQFAKEGQSEEEGLPGLALGTSFLSVDTEGRVLRLDSFSKLMAPGFRIGWITGAPALLRCYRQHAYAASQWGCSLSMQILAAILHGWGDARFEQVVVETQAAYKLRRDAVLAAAAEHLTDVATWDVPAAGFFLWVSSTRHALRPLLALLSPAWAWAWAWALWVSSPASEAWPANQSHCRCRLRSRLPPEQTPPFSTGEASLAAASNALTKKSNSSKKLRERERSKTTV
jgi:hypothetical protein